MPPSFLKRWDHFRRKASKVGRSGQKSNSQSAAISQPDDPGQPPNSKATKSRAPLDSLDGKSGVDSSTTTVVVSEVTPAILSPLPSSLTPLPSSSKLQQTNAEDFRGDSDPLGITVLHTPPSRTVDILFIHGLGGSSVRTWCWERKVAYFWPKLWLPNEIPTARILTFGYDANFSKRKQVSFTLDDFANDLLFRMKYSETTPERLGQVPIIIVAHSMGGLVFKKAFTQGHSNPEFSAIISMIRAVLFLATPHRGSDLASILNAILSASFPFGHSPKKYIRELDPRSATLDDLNDSFRHFAPKLQIFSFYETVATAIGPVSPTIVEKWSAVTGYPNETSAPLAADHHTVCKFTGPGDPNFVAVIGALRRIVETLTSEDEIATTHDLKTISNLLGITSPPEDDLAVISSFKKDGTCEGFLECAEVKSWLSSQTTQILWAYAPPGSGKSITCSFIVEYLLASGYRCAYFFFKYGQSYKQSTKDLLLSLAYQTACQIPEYRRAIVELTKSISASRIANSDFAYIWRTLFSGLLSQIEITVHFYWVIDGVDESNSSKQTIQLLSQSSQFKLPLKILVFSRPLPHIDYAFKKAKAINIVKMALPENQNDIRKMVTEEIDYLPCENIVCANEFKEQIVNEITSRSQGNFLWASLITQQVVKCHRQDQIKRLLNTMPTGMDQLYHRMMDSVAALETKEDRALAQILLLWAAYARMPISLEELVDLYPTAFTSVLDLHHTVNEVCGQFVVIDPQGRISLVHHSAREYLENTQRHPFNLTSGYGHEELLVQCLTVLSDPSLKRKLQNLTIPRFLSYAARWWIAHLENCPIESDRVREMVIKFFKRTFPLSWIQYLAMSGQLSGLYAASSALSTYARKWKTATANGLLANHNANQDASLLESWATDLAKLPASFYHHLSDQPEVIYTFIPSLCPTSSILYKMFANSPFTVLATWTHGFANRYWDDCLACILPKQNHLPVLALAVSTSTLALGVGTHVDSKVVLRDTKLFREQKTFDLQDKGTIKRIVFNNSGSLVACITRFKTYVWNVVDGSLRLTTDMPNSGSFWELLDVTFSKTDDLLMLLLDSVDSRTGSAEDTPTVQPTFLRLNTHLTGSGPHVTTGSSEWEQLYAAFLWPEGKTYRPVHALFDHDAARVAFSHSGENVTTKNILSVYSLNPQPRLESQQKLEDITAFSWHPSGTSIIGINRVSYGYLKLFDWNTDEQVIRFGICHVGKSDGEPDMLRCNPNGQTFATVGRGIAGPDYIDIYTVSSLLRIQRLEAPPYARSLGKVDICFPPDGTRLYSSNQSVCRVWESTWLGGLGVEEPGLNQHSLHDANGGEARVLQEGVTPLAISSDVQHEPAAALLNLTQELPAEPHIPGDQLPNFWGYTIPALGVGWSSSRPLVACVSEKNITLWDPDRGLEHTIDAPSPPLSRFVWNAESGVLVFFSSRESEPSTRSVALLSILLVSPDFEAAREPQRLSTTKLELSFPVSLDPAKGQNIRQVLVNAEGSRLLVHHDTASLLLSLSDGAVLLEQPAGDTEIRISRSTVSFIKWFQHPVEAQYVVRFTPTSISVFSWDNLEKVSNLTVNLGGILPSDNTPSSKKQKDQKRPEKRLTKIKFTLNSIHYDNHCPDLFLISLKASMLEPPKQSDLRRMTHTRLEMYDRDVIIPLQRLYADTSATAEIPFLNSISPILLSNKFKAGMYCPPFGILPDGHLVFLDRQCWVCTVPLLPLPVYCPSLPTNDAKIKRHFFLPNTWVGENNLEGCRLLRDGRLLLPIKNDFVLLGWIR